MVEIIHGHEILNLIKENSFKSKEELKATLDNKFGNVNFTNCSKKEYTFEEIMSFFEEKGKVVQKEDSLTLNLQTCSCSH
jgi:probable metal-binding protein